MSNVNVGLTSALRAVLAFRGGSNTLGYRIREIEEVIVGLTQQQAMAEAHRLGVDDDLLAGAILVKEASAQIDVILHAAGIIKSLPFILDPTEQIEYVSLGAGNTGRSHDLATDRQVAEFKFIKWQGGAESVRQDSLLIDVFHLATSETDRRRALYLTGAAIPLRFLATSKRNVAACLARRPGVSEQFNRAYGSVSMPVHRYWELVREAVEIIDLEEIVPALKTRPVIAT